ncbi:hypothetical protein C8Q75DRAFT_361028 [Abortiporus biennis]|nr:hypothetical protein C8Q75DRAFT_361028 [Abortiporus biennis]
MEPGWYTITSMVEEQYVVGRAIGEDRSLHDKAIFLLPNIKEQITIAPVWNIEKMGEDRYRFSTRGDFTAIQDDRVFAILDPFTQRPEKYVLTAQPQHGENVYTIQTNDEEKGWTADGGEHSQVFCFIFVSSLSWTSADVNLFLFISARSQLDPLPALTVFHLPTPLLSC